MHAPGIRFEVGDTGPSPAALRTDVAAFIGFAPQGPAGQPVPVDSYTQFETVFGPPREDLHLGWCVRGFFENGGVRCWICRVTAPDAMDASIVLPDANGPAFRIAAESVGVWGNELSMVLQESTRVMTRALGPIDEGRRVVVDATTDFKPRDLVRLTQPGGFDETRVINTVDHADGWIAWAGASASDQLPTDAPLSGTDPALPLLLTRLRYRLTVLKRGIVAAVYDDLGIVPQGARYMPDVLRGSPALLRATDLRPAPGGPVAPLILPSAAQFMSGGVDGLATVRPADFRRAFDAFDRVDEPALFAAPDLHTPDDTPQRYTVPRIVPDPCLDCPPIEPMPPSTPSAAPDRAPGFSEEEIAQLQHRLLDVCAARPNAFAVLDMPRTLATRPAATAHLLSWRRRFTQSHGALFWPWLLLPRALGASGTARPTPCAGHVAGQIAATDLAVGVHRAPANQRMTWVQATTLDVPQELHGILNAEGVNVLRATSGRGLRIMGARTLSFDPLWRFVPVRRLMSTVGHVLAVSSRWALFEPNTHATRAKLAALFDAYLTNIWRSGALAGAEPREAFFVRPERAELESFDGRLTISVGLAPLNPLEFIVFRIGREDGSVNTGVFSVGRMEGAA